MHALCVTCITLPVFKNFPRSFFLATAMIIARNQLFWVCHKCVTLRGWRRHASHAWAVPAAMTCQCCGLFAREERLSALSLIDYVLSEWCMCNVCLAIYDIIVIIQHSQQLTPISLTCNDYNTYISLPPNFTTLHIVTTPVLWDQSARSEQSLIMHFTVR